MKALLCVLFFIMSGISSFSQPKSGYYMWPYNASDKIEFSETIYPGISNADSIYSHAQSFMTGHFRGERDSVSTNERSHTVLCKGAFYIPIPEAGEKGKGYIGFTLSISCRYNAYRYVLTNIEHFAQKADGVSGGPLENDRAACGGMLLPMLYWNNEKARAYYYIQTTIERLKEAMSVKANG